MTQHLHLHKSPADTVRVTGTSAVSGTVDRHATNRIGLTSFAAAVSISAFAGAIGLMFGSLDLGQAVTARLPFDSPVFAGLALALIVGAPTAAVASFAWRRDARVDEASDVAGLALIAWIAVQALVIHQFSWLQPTFLAIGVLFFVIGQRDAWRR